MTDASRFLSLFASLPLARGNAPVGKGAYARQKDDTLALLTAG